MLSCNETVSQQNMQLHKVDYIAGKCQSSAVGRKGDIYSQKENAKAQMAKTVPNGSFEAHIAQVR